jgi:catechol 2,3-dioxygenase-like lactoylglutathione lyase family enzyme
LKLNHLNLCINDLPEAIDFFQTLFDFQQLDRKGDAIAVMTDGEGFTLVLSNLRTDGDEAIAYPKDFHVGFYVETPAEVDRFYDKIAAANIPVDHEP